MENNMRAGEEKGQLRRKDKMTWRHEYKHWITIADWVSLRHRLGAVMRHDGHADANGEYHIRSLYFDNQDNQVLREKVNGQRYREKFRIRLYNGDPDTLRLERKTRCNGLGRKESVRLTPAEAQQLALGDASFVVAEAPALLQALKADMDVRRLRGATVVDYRREAFVMPAGNVRVTFDREIRTGLKSVDFLNGSLPTVPTTCGDNLVLEVKYDAFLPQVVRDCLQLGSRQATAVSKYAMCRIWG
jgi:hypothetical protein